MPGRRNTGFEYRLRLQFENFESDNKSLKVSSFEESVEDTRTVSGEFLTPNLLKTKSAINYIFKKKKKIIKTLKIIISK